MTIVRFDEAAVNNLLGENGQKTQGSVYRLKKLLVVINPKFFKKNYRLR